MTHAQHFNICSYVLQDGTELRVGRRLSDYNVACLDTLVLRERGSVRVSVAVEVERTSTNAEDSSLCITVEVGVDPEDTLVELGRRAALKSIQDDGLREHLGREADAVFYLEDKKLESHGTVMDYGLTSMSPGQAVKCM